MLLMTNRLILNLHFSQIDALKLKDKIQSFLIIFSSEVIECINDFLKKKIKKFGCMK